MSKWQLIEQGAHTANYGIVATEAVVEHPERGRLYITEGYGGESSLQGGTVRWRHGCAWRIKPTETLRDIAALAEESWNDTTSRLEAMMHGCDDERPILEDVDVPRIARAVGL